MLPAEQAFPVGDQDPVSAAVVEPMSIAVRAVVRGRVAGRGEGCRVRRRPDRDRRRRCRDDKGAEVLLVDPYRGRASSGRRRSGADRSTSSSGAMRSRPLASGPAATGPEVVFEATGVAEVAQTGVELVAPAGRVVIVGPRDRAGAARDGPPRVQGGRPARHQLLQRGRLRRGGALVDRRRDALAGFVTHEFPLEEAPEAIVYAMRHPAEVMKAVIRLDGRRPWR